MTLRVGVEVGGTVHGPGRRRRRSCPDCQGIRQRHNRKRIYDLFYRKPVPVVARADTIEIAAEAALDRIWPHGRYEAVAICLLDAYANLVHERRLAELIRARRPDLPVTCSADVTREFREYERASTVSLAAYVQPVIDGYHVLRKGRLIPIGSKQSFVLEKDDVLVMLTGGGAGYGEPADRPRHLIEHDLDQGLIRPATARRVYRLVRAS